MLLYSRTNCCRSAFTCLSMSPFSRPPSQNTTESGVKRSKQWVYWIPVSLSRDNIFKSHETIFNNERIQFELRIDFSQLTYMLITLSIDENGVLQRRRWKDFSHRQIFSLTKYGVKNVGGGRRTRRRERSLNVGGGREIGSCSCFCFSRMLLLCCL